MDYVKASLLKSYTIEEATLERDCDDFANMLIKFKLTEGDEKEEN